MILIAGDSWGCGEWNEFSNIADLCRDLQHGGLAFYLREQGHNVTNLSAPGNSNSAILKSIRYFLQMNPWVVNPGSAIFYFQTEWTRDLKEIKNQTTTYFDDNDLEIGYPAIADRFMSRTYYALSNLSVKYSVPIYIIGGHADTLWFEKFSEEYPGLHVACQSLTNLVINNNHRTDSPCHDQFSLLNVDAIEKLKNRVDHNNQWLNNLLLDLDKGRARQNFLRANKEYFWPDGYHANRLAHKKLFDLLTTTIPELQ